MLTGGYSIPKKWKETSDLSFYRRVKSTGDSFYMSFMYAYFERLIQKEKFFIIRELFYILNEKSKAMQTTVGIKGSFSPFVTNEVLIILLKIYQLMDERKDKAYKLLNRAFSYNENFVHWMSKLMKLKIKDFIHKNKNLFTYETCCVNNKLISEYYFDKETKEFSDDKYIDDSILINHLEPDIFLILIVPWVFEVQMDLYINEKEKL